MNKKCKEILEKLESKGTIKIWKDFEFPEGFDSGIRLKDLLENEVDEKYYINQEKCEKLIESLKGREIIGPGINISRKGEKFENETDTSLCLLAKDYKGLGNQQMTAVCIPCIPPERLEKRQNGRRFKEDGDPSFTLTAQDRHGVLCIDDTQGFDGVRTYDDKVPTLRADRSGLKVLEENEPQILRSIRTEYGKEIRKQYESGEIQEENKVIKKYDIPKEILNDNERQRRVYDIEGISPTVLSRTDSTKVEVSKNELKQVGMINIKGNEQVRRVYDTSGLCPTLNTMQGGNREPKIIEPQENYNEVNMLGLLGESGYEHNRRVYDSNGVMATVSQREYKDPLKVMHNFRIRKLTPKECWRLMGFRDKYFYSAKDLSISDSALYKQAGNSIVVNVLYHIFKNLFKDYMI